MQKFIHEAAPNLLLEKIAELSSILAKYKAKNAPQEQLNFYENLLRVMRFSYSFMRETAFIHSRNIMLESNLKWLTEYNAELQDKVNELDTITKLRCEGRLEQVMDEADKYVEKVMSLHSLAAKNKNT